MTTGVAGFMSAVLHHIDRERDCQLVRRHREGDPAAFAELYATYHPRLLRFLRRRVSQPQIAEDLAHEAFTRALSGIDNFRDGSGFYPWLTGIARHLLIRHYRDTGRVAPLTQTDAWSIDAPEFRILRRVEQDFMTTALNRIRARHREVLRLRETEELSYEAIAAQLGIPLTTVPPLLHRARLALRREYLAVTAEGNLALVPVLASAAAGLRRLRDRLLHIVAHVPDGATVTASMAAAAIGVASLFSPSPSTVERGESTAVNALASAQTSPSRQGGSWHRSQPAGSVPANATAHTSSDVISVTRYHPDVAVDEEEMRRRRTDSQHMPYSTEVGPTWIGADPDQMQRDLQSSLAGDYGWMEG